MTLSQVIEYQKHMHARYGHRKWSYTDTAIMIYVLEEWEDIQLLSETFRGPLSTSMLVRNVWCAFAHDKQTP